MRTKNNSSKMRLIRCFKMRLKVEMKMNKMMNKLR